MNDLIFANFWEVLVQGDVHPLAFVHFILCGQCCGSSVEHQFSRGVARIGHRRGACRFPILGSPVTYCGYIDYISLQEMECDHQFDCYWASGLGSWELGQALISLVQLQGCGVGKCSDAACPEAQ